MTNKYIIRYHKWRKKEYNDLFNSLREYLNIQSLQFYMPFYSLFFYVHNTPNSNQVIDLERNFYIKKVNSILKERYYNSNYILSGEIYDSNKNTIEEKEFFCKTIPIVDAMHCINNNYNFVNKTNYHLPSPYNYNTFHKINNIDNTAYIDVLCSFLFGRLTYYKKSPSFSLFYGSVNGVGDYNYDITEEYQDIKVDKCFNKTIDKGFTLNMYMSDSDSDSDSGSDSDSIESIHRSSLSSFESESIPYVKSISMDDSNDYIAQLKNIPLQMLFIEKLEGTLEDLLEDNISEEILLSCIFQISFALIYLQNHFHFTHNDLHINNIMYVPTTTKYLYYKYNNMYFRVPTHGMIFKIIDFGRAIFTYRNKIYMNDAFAKFGEAGGQYTYPSQVNFMKQKHKELIQPNYHFDLCRLSMTILEDMNQSYFSNEIIQFLKNICIDKYNNNFCDMIDNFDLYINIAKNACNSLPRDIIMYDIFKKYRIKKKLFPRKSFYTI